MKKIKSATVLHEGWEMDNEAWIEQDLNGKLHLMSTNHGRECVMTIEELDLKIKETEDSLKQLNVLRVSVE